MAWRKSQRAAAEQIGASEASCGVALKQSAAKISAYRRRQQSALINQICAQAAIEHRMKAGGSEKSI